MISKKNQDVLTEVRPAVEVSLVYTISEIFKTIISEEASLLFRTTPAIVSVDKSVHAVQVIIINKWITELLLTYRSNNDNIRIDDVLMCLNEDTYVSDWVKIYNLVIVPFIKKNNILK